MGMRNVKRLGAAIAVVAMVCTGQATTAASAGGTAATPAAGSPDKPVVSDSLRSFQDDDPRRRSVSDDSGAKLVQQRSDGAPLVYVRTEYVDTAPVAEAIAALDGAEVVHETSNFITAYIPGDQLSSAGEIDGVRSILGAHAPITRCGNALSEGDAVMQADDARLDNGVDGTGITVGILSDSFDQAIGTATTAAQDVASGDLPGTGSPCGSQTDVEINTPLLPCAEPPCAVPIDEGRAMAQIVHDLAPGADITFGSAFNGFFAFADEIRALAANGADVLVDDIGYFVAPFFQQGPVGNAVSDVVADGVTYFSALGNDRVLGPGGTDQTAYETPASRPTACTAPLLVGEFCHDFRAGVGADTTWRYTIPAGQTLTLDLQWNQPWLGVATDLDLAVLNSTGTDVLDASVDDNVASGIPVEVVSVEAGGAPLTVQVSVVHFSGPNPRFRMTHLRSSFSSSEYTTVTAPDTLGGGFAYGHPASPDAIGVGAAPYFQPDTPESFSSRGPVTYYWEPTDVALAGNSLVGSPSPALPTPQVIAKPDVAGIDGGVNTFFGSGNRFFGTSAAAPHVAAVAALLLEANPQLTPAGVEQLLVDYATPLTNGDSTQWGAGLVNAADAVAAAIELTKPTRFVPVDPARLLDTRPSEQIGYSGGKPGAGSTVDFQVTGRGGVPSSGAVRAVVLAVTATQSSRSGFVTAHPTGVTLPLAANVLLERTGQTISNQVVVALSEAGRASLFTNGGTHLVADVVGYYEEVESSTNGRFQSVNPTRLLDTRPSEQVGYTGPKPGSGATVDVQLGGAAGVPADATGVILNVTTTSTTAPGFVTVFPEDVARPLAATLTVEGSGQTIGTHATVGLSATGEISVYTSRSSHLIVDVVGYYTAPSASDSADGLFVPYLPTRLLDTRFGVGFPLGSKPAKDGTFELQIGGRGVIPEIGAGAAVMNLTVVQTPSAGFINVYGSDLPFPQTSSLNSDRAGQTRPNLVTTALSSFGGGPDHGAVDVFTNISAHLVGDVAGYFIDEL